MTLRLTGPHRQTHACVQSLQAIQTSSYCRVPWPAPITGNNLSDFVSQMPDKLSAERNSACAHFMYTFNWYFKSLYWLTYLAAFIFCLLFSLFVHSSGWPFVWLSVQLRGNNDGGRKIIQITETFKIITVCNVKWGNMDGGLAFYS